VRVTTAFNKMLSIPAATVASVEFTDEGVVVGLRRRAGVPVAHAARKALASTTAPRAVGGTWTWAPASCCCRPRSAGCTAGAATGL
jgi:ribosomal protein S2